MGMNDMSECAGLPVNISEKQRVISSVLGGALLALGILDFRKSALRKAIRLTVGSLLLMRGASGYCLATALKESLERKKMDALDEELAKESEGDMEI
jgi:uncharacterized membrane protein